MFYIYIYVNIYLYSYLYYYYFNKLAVGLTIAASLFTVAINVFLKNAMKALAKKEFHNTLDEENVCLLYMILNHFIL